MTLSIWRYAHLALAIISSVFLVMASVTGAILAIDAIQEKMPPYRVSDFDQITISQSLPFLKKKYLEISELSVDHNGFVLLKALDYNGNEIDAYINPINGDVLGKVKEKSAFIQWNIALHRSLFLKETGRLIIGLVSFLLILITVSGFALVVQRQRGISKFFTRVIKKYFSQYYHVITGRLMLIPIFIIAFSGTYLSMARFQLFPAFNANHKEIVVVDTIPEQKNTSDFDIFKTTKLASIKKIEFPFADDPQEFYNLKLADRELIINQFNGHIESELKYPKTILLENLSLDLHTGRTNIFWAIILGIACINILFLIYSGFVITFKRTATKVKNKHKAKDAEYILLVGSENGSTFGFANAIHQQLQAQGKISYLAQLNSYTVYPKSKHLLVFTSTYGLGDPPSNANRALQLIEKYPQTHKIDYTVVGFGSHAYPDFCVFAKNVEEKLRLQDWANPITQFFTIDDKSPQQFTAWVKEWSSKADVELATTPALYAKKPKGLRKMMVLDKTEVSETEQTFMLTIRSPDRARFTSGDLLAIYPANDHRERLYSVAKFNGNIQLVVKLHKAGLGSEYLNSLKVGDVFKARLVTNLSFHQPKNKAITMIANGTGIAPFLGMINQSKKYADISLYVGFRNQTEVVKQHQIFFDHQVKQHQLRHYKIAFSREQNHCYVMDLIRKDAQHFANLLNANGVIMICGSLLMQQDVEKVLEEICQNLNGKPLSYYQENKQLLSDCY